MCTIKFIIQQILTTVEPLNESVFIELIVKRFNILNHIEVN